VTDENRQPDEGDPAAEVPDTSAQEHDPEGKSDTVTPHVASGGRAVEPGPASADASESLGATSAESAGSPAEASGGSPAASASPEGSSVPSGESSAEAAAASSKPAKPVPDRPKPNPALMRAYRTHRPVEGTIAAVIKGGYEVKVGKSRGFCPHSQIALEREDDPDSHVGKTYPFRITQLRRGGQDLVLSRRAVLEEQRAEEAKAVRATLVEGGVMQGRVAGVADFGAFIDLGAGVLGLVHISELSHQRVTRVADIVAVGDTVHVKVAKIDDEHGRISLSMRKVEEDPWAKVDERFPPGKVVPGKVVRLAEFGAFVEIAPHVEALAPASELPPAPGGWAGVLSPGTEREWVVLAVDRRRRRIALTIPSDRPQAAIEPSAEVSGKVQRLEPYGAFVWLGPGRVGLMPRAWCGLKPGETLERRFPIGTDVEVRVVDVTDGGKRIRLAARGVSVEPEAPAAPRQPPVRPRAEEPPRPRDEEGSFGTSLGDKLRAAFDRRDRS
jgi:small subunit ribosomal protein S1